MTGTLAGALAARKIPTQPDRLTADVEGFIENVDGKPLVTRIKVRYTVRSRRASGRTRSGPSRCTRRAARRRSRSSVASPSSGTATSVRTT